MSGNIGKYKLLPREDVLLRKSILEKAATTKKIQYLSLSRNLKKSKQHCRKTIPKNWQLKMVKNKQLKKYKTWNSICNQECNSYEFTDVNKFWNLFFE